MRMLIALMLLVLPGPALAQSWSPPDWRDPAASAADRHRWEMDRLRARSDASEALAQRQRLETRLMLMELQASRAAAVTPPDQVRVLGPLETERARRQAMERRAAVLANGTGEIDAWLNRPISEP